MIPGVLARQVSNDTPKVHVKLNDVCHEQQDTGGVYGLLKSVVVAWLEQWAGVKVAKGRYYLNHDQEHWVGLSQGGQAGAAQVTALDY